MSHWSELFQQHISEMQQRVATALNETNYQSLVIFSGAPTRVFQDDWDYGFVVNHWFKQWVPESLPWCFVVTDGVNKPTLVYYQPVDYWHAVAGAPQGFWTECFDVQVVSSVEAAASFLPKHKATSVVLGQDHPVLRQWGFTEFNTSSISHYLGYHRAYKTDFEVESMVVANDQAAKAHLAAKDAFMSGACELDIHLAYLKAVNCREAHLPYHNIIACDQNTAVLHYDNYRKSTEGKTHRSLLVDAGAACHGYASDITRTWARESGEYAELIQVMDKAELAIIDNIALGNSYVELHKQMHYSIASILKQFEFVNLSEEEMVVEGISATFFPHGLGHFIGAQVHDIAGKIADDKGNPIAQPEGHPYLRLLRPIEARQVFTIEPGLYFIEQLLSELRQSPKASAVNWSKIDAFKAYGGVRVEDCVLVTELGVRNLSREAFSKHQ